MLRASRTEQRLRLDVFAEMIGYHWTTVSRWERGECFPSLRALHDWCEALGVQLTLTDNRLSLISATDTARKIPTMAVPLDAAETVCHRRVMNKP
jgi:transcriptional regulator with XRE-family HTH domain